MKFKKGDIVKINEKNVYRYNYRFVKKYRNVFFKIARIETLRAGTLFYECDGCIIKEYYGCKMKFCKGIICSDSNGMEIQAANEDELIKATDREKFLYYTYGSYFLRDNNET